MAPTPEHSLSPIGSAAQPSSRWRRTGRAGALTARRTLKCTNGQNSSQSSNRYWSSGVRWARSLQCSTGTYELWLTTIR